MSINHFFSQDQHHHPEAHWWSHYTSMDSPKASSSSSLSSHPHPGPPHISSSSSHNSTTPFWLHPSSAAAAPMNAFDDDDEHASQTPACRESEQQEEEEIPKERLFEKPLTPSDVGKLNRLVIPKQHAEKHFPLNTTAASGENGLLLGFEDEVGKSWRFRYSYWNSSQSYVLTKGWSRFVKEKRLDAGDIVMFARHSVDTARFFIGWRRRNSQPPVAAAGGWGRLFCSSSTSNSLSFQPLLPHAPLLHAPPPPPPGGVQNQTTTSSGSGNSKRHLRLFGVNLECSHATEDDSEPSTPVSHPQSHHHHPYHQQYYSSNHHMDISFSGGGADVYRQG